jgi:hypothetical protein
MATIPSPNIVIYGDLFVVPPGATGSASTAADFDAVYDSGFSTVILFTLFVHPGGDIVYAASPPPIVSGGAFDATRYGHLQDTLAALKTGGTVKLVLFCIGAGQTDVWANIQTLLQTDSGKQTLQENFAALMEAIPAIDGFDFDAEGPYVESNIVELTKILTANGTNGKIITFCPYWNQPPFWTQCMQQIYSEFSSMTGPTAPTTLQPVAWWNVQCYSGGAANISILPRWVRDCSAPGTGITGGAAPAFIVPGLGAPATPPAPTGPVGVQDQFAAWAGQVPGLDGGFIYSSDGMLPGATVPPGSNYTMQQYASAIIDGLRGATGATG